MQVAKYLISTNHYGKRHVLPTSNYVKKLHLVLIFFRNKLKCCADPSVILNFPLFQPQTCLELLVPFFTSI